jgi:hypothetical protein
MGACSAIYVQKLRDGKWHVWRGWTNVDTPPPKPYTGNHLGVLASRGEALCVAHDSDDFSRTSDGVIELNDEVQPLRDDQEAAEFFRRALLPRAEVRDPFPMWTGWALVEAFLAGARHARAHQEQA